MTINSSISTFNVAFDKNLINESTSPSMQDSLLIEYKLKNWGLIDLQNELQSQIVKYNRATGKYLFVYAADVTKGKAGTDVSLSQEDFYAIQDLLRGCPKDIVDFYIETPGGSGEAAEEIARFLHNKFKEVNFVIAAEAKSAGTILALSGDNIIMSETGSLGPIDAQMRIGRSVVSAHDYKVWIDGKYAEASQTGRLNPVDAQIISQISPGEIAGVVNALEFAKDLVKDWLEKYKFKNWTETRDQKTPVTPQMKKRRAEEVADLLCDHTTWRSHGRSLKIADLESYLIVDKLEDSPATADAVYRIKTILRLIFDSSTVYKQFCGENVQISRTATNGASQGQAPKAASNGSGSGHVVVEIDCPKCGAKNPVNGYFDITSQEISQRRLKTNTNLSSTNILRCQKCLHSIDINPIKNEIESQRGQRLTFK